jgi:ketosteroid isomerase-like protein
VKSMLAFRLLLALLACVSTQGPRELHGQTMSDDEETIRALEERVRLGVLHRDIEALEPLWSEAFMVNAPNNRVAPNRGVVLDLIRQGLIHYTSYETRIENLRIDDDLAIVMGAETVQPTGIAAMTGQTVERRYTHIWKKDDDRWLLVARHANVVSP